MKYWSELKLRLNDGMVLASQLLLLVLGAYTLIMAEKHSFWKIPLLFAGLMGWFFWRHKTNYFFIWLIFLMLLIVDLFKDYFWVANHHFMLTFMVLSVLLYSQHNRSAVLLKNIKIIVVIVVMASAIQKLMSEQFMSGDFYYYMLNRGSFFRKFINFSPEHLDIVKSNADNLLALKDTNPNLAQNVVLKPIFLNVSVFSLVFAWFTVIIELLVAIAILLKPKSTWTHLLFTAMILGILCTRLETGFMALLAICGLLLCKNLKLRLLYTMIVMGCFILIVTKLGYH